jgi:Glycosyltransferase family 87
VISDDRLRACGLSGRTVLLFGPIVRVLLTVVVLAFGAQQCLVYAEIVRTTVTVRHSGDFNVFYRSSQRVANAGGDPYDVVAESGTTNLVRTPNLNPPQVVLLLVPLTLFDPRTALWIWAAVSAASALLALRIIFREVPIRLGWQSSGWTLFALLCAAPTGALLFATQISWLLWGPVTWVWAAARRNRWKRAALVLGVTMSVKPFLGLLLMVLVVRKRWAAFTIALTTAIGCFAVGIAALGWPTFVSWVRALRSITWADHIFNASLLGFFERLFGNHPERTWNLAPIASAPAVIQPLWLVAAAAVVSATAWVLYRRDASDALASTDGRTFDTDRMFALSLAAALLTSPLAWIYYDFFLAGPFIALCADGRWRNGFSWRMVLFGCAAFALTLSPGTLASAQPSAWATFSIGSAYFWSSLAFWICALPGRRVTLGSLAPGARHRR